jgi:hypothetical protein
MQSPWALAGVTDATLETSLTQPGAGGYLGDCDSNDLYRSCGLSASAARVLSDSSRMCLNLVMSA